jgi:four helix bundle protein
MHFRKLEVYKIAIRVLALAAKLDLPSGHGDLRDQLRRASLSVVLNIAESSGKTTFGEQRRFFAIARGSAMECAAIVDVCRVFDVGQTSLLESIDAGLLSVVRILSKLAR